MDFNPSHSQCSDSQNLVHLFHISLHIIIVFAGVTMSELFWDEKHCTEKSDCLDVIQFCDKTKFKAGLSYTQFIKHLYVSLGVRVLQILFIGLDRWCSLPLPALLCLSLHILLQKELSFNKAIAYPLLPSFIFRHFTQSLSMCQSYQTRSQSIDLNKTLKSKTCSRGQLKGFSEAT